MAYDEGLAQRIREKLQDQSGCEELTMFGGIGFLLHGNMACGVVGEDLIVRVGPERYQEALEETGVREFDLTGRPMTGWAAVAPAVTRTEEGLRKWVEKGVGFVSNLMPK